jgi:MATE family multidrug resistance protein
VLYYTAAVIGMGMVLGLDTLVSQSFGAGDIAGCHHSLLNSVYLCVPVTLALMGILWLLSPLLRSSGIDAGVLREAIPYLRALTWGTFPLLLFFAFRRYLQGMNLVQPVMFVLISANLMNLVGNWALIYGHLGAPAMGSVGSGWATCISRIYMGVMLPAYIFYHDRRYKTGLGGTSIAPDMARIGELIRLGVPAAMQMAFEVGVFAVVTTLIGRVGAEVLAAHQIAMNLASVTFMVPLGIGAAAAVRVGQARGRGDVAGANRAGWTAILLGAVFMFCAGVVFILVPRSIIHIYTSDPRVVEAGVTLLAVAAVFELFDGVQGVTTGALRGAGDTRTPMICHLVGYWGLGLPVGWWLCFRLNLGALGLWMGLCLALIAIGSVLMAIWWKRTHAAAMGAAQ